VESGKVKKSYRILFEHLLYDLKNQEKNSYVWNKFLHDKTTRYLEESSDAQKVIDYLSGMTDNFFIKTLEILMVPKPIEWVN
jgi:dGTPase